MLPYHQQIATNRYRQFNFSYPVLLQQEDRDTNQILRREFSLFDFKPTSYMELENKQIIRDSTTRQVRFNMTRRVDKINLASQYTWTLNNMKDAEGNLVDPKWEYNRFIGWEKRVSNMTYSGSYTAERVGFISWGNSKPFISNSPNSLNNSLIINFPESNNSGLIVDESSNNSGAVIIRLPNDIDAIDVVNLDGDSQLYWLLENDELESIPLGVHFIKSNRIKLVLGSSTTFYTHDRPNYSLNLNTDIDLESYISSKSYYTYTSNNYIKVDLLEARLEDLQDMRVIENQPVEWEIKEEGSVDFTNPLPTTPINIPINLEVFN